MIGSRLLAFWRDERAAVTPMVAALAVTLVGATGLVLDAGLFYVGNRQLKAATEAAALAAAIDPSKAYDRANAYLGKNGFPGLLMPEDVEVGRYCADKNITDPKARFIGPTASCPDTSPTNPQANAVRLTTHKESKRFLTRILDSLDPIPDLTATATAARIDEAGIATTGNILGTDGTKLVGGLLQSVNKLLGQLLGITLALTDEQVIAMMQHNVDAGDFFDHLAVNLDLVDGVGRTKADITYGRVLEEKASMKDLLLSASQAAADSATSQALASLAGSVSADRVIDLHGLFGLGVWKNMPVGEANAQTGLRAGLNAYQLLTYAAQAKGASSLDLSSLTGATFPDSTVKLTIIGSTPTSRPRFSFGPPGETSVSSSVSRLQLKVRLVDTGISSGLLGILRLLGVSIDLATDIPVLISIGDSNATIKEIRCTQTGEQARDAQVDVAVSPALISAYVGEVRADAVNSTMPYIDPAAVTPVTILNAKLLGIPLTSITAKAAVLPVTGGDTTVTFGPRGSGNPQIGTPGSAQSSEIIGTPYAKSNQVRLGETISSLVANLDIQPSVAGISLNILTPLLQIAGNLLKPLLTGLLDGLLGPVLDNLLSALGLELGNARVWVTGARCGVPVLV